MKASAIPVLNGTERSRVGEDDIPLRKGGLQLRVFTWLSVLASNLRNANPESEPEKMLIDSGVYDQLRHGDVRFEDDL